MPLAFERKSVDNGFDLAPVQAQVLQAVLIQGRQDENRRAALATLPVSSPQVSGLIKKPRIRAMPG
jgi:hypothetical protein